MEDASLFTDYEQLYNDGETLVTNSETMKTNIESIRNLIKEDWSSWIGSDNVEYVNSLKSFLTKLSYYEEEVNRIGSFMEKLSSDYSNHLANRAKELNNNE